MWFLWHCGLCGRLQVTLSVWLPFPHQASKCQSTPLFWSTKFLEENLDSCVEYYALRGNFIYVHIYKIVLRWKYKLCEPHRANSCICFGRQPPQARERRDGRRTMANPQWPLCLLSLTSCSPVPGLLMKILCAREKHWAVLPNAGGVLHSILFTGLTQEIKTDGLW